MVALASTQSNSMEAIDMLYQGDCLDVLRTLADNSVDAVCTDPPAGIGFMMSKDRQCDSDKGGRKQWIAWLTEVMEEVIRILRPGGHAFVWALPRTSHWTATALEDAGFEFHWDEKGLTGRGMLIGVKPGGSIGDGYF